MNQEQINQLSKIYNTLCLIETKGENTIIMGNCLAALQSFIRESAAMTIQQEEQNLDKKEE